MLPNSILEQVGLSMLVCDLDGTLLNGSGVLSLATIDAVHTAIEAGIELVIATGRRHSYATEVLAPLALDADTVLISSNGAITRTLGGETLERKHMPIATALELCGFADYRDSLVFTFDRTGPGALAVENIAELERRLPRWASANRHEIQCFAPLERAFDSGEAPVQAMVCGNLEEMRRATLALEQGESAADSLRRQISVHRTEYAHRDLSVMDLMQRGCSKGTAVANLAALRGLAAGDVVCVGDNMNDADMLAFSGQPLVMKNAHLELLALAAANGWPVIGSNEEDGAAQAILGILEGLSAGAGS